MMTEEEKAKVLAGIELIRARNNTSKIVVTSIYWLTASIMVILKIMGISNLTWFWTLLPVAWPFYVLALFVGVCIFCAIGAIIILAIIAGIEEYEKRKDK